jgi:hypothetical protein
VLSVDALRIIIFQTPDGGALSPQKPLAACGAASLCELGIKRKGRKEK